MNINKIYKYENEDEAEYIFVLDDDRKIIKRSGQKIEKLNLKKWEIISFIPEDFQKLKREATTKEVKKVKKFLKNNKSQKNNNFWDKIKKIFK